jgi:NitT/TauT family transport system permease protein
MLCEVLFPGALREIVAGLRISAGTGWQSLVGAELVVGTTGLGYMIVQAEAGLNSETVMAGMVVIGLLGAAMDYGLSAAERRLARHALTP